MYDIYVRILYIDMHMFIVQLCICICSGFVQLQEEGQCHFVGSCLNAGPFQGANSRVGDRAGPGGRSTKQTSSSTDV